MPTSMNRCISTEKLRNGWDGLIPMCYVLLKYRGAQACVHTQFRRTGTLLLETGLPEALYS